MDRRVKPGDDEHEERGTESANNEKEQKENNTAN
jgi:hypothetical protein